MHRMFLSRGLWLSGLFGLILCVALLSTDPTIAEVRPNDESQTTHVYIGSVEGGGDGARIAFVVDGDNFIAYVCGVEDSFNAKYSAWFKGAMTNKAIEAKTPKAKLDAVVNAKGINGTVKAGDMSLAFKAIMAEKVGSIAGLYRAELKTETEDLVAGWIADEDDEIVGAILDRRTGKVIGNPKQSGKIDIPNLSINRGNQQINSQQVQNPKNPPQGKKQKPRPTEAEFQQRLNGIRARARAIGGNPILAASIQQVRRFLSGAQPANSLEQQTFAALRKAPSAALSKYLKDWDKLPAGVRSDILGDAAAELPATQPLTATKMRAIFTARTARREASSGPRPTAPGTVTPITLFRIREIDCIDPTGIGSGAINPDEVFAVYVISNSKVGFSKTTATQQMKRGDVRFFPAPDSTLLPSAELGSTSEDLFIGVGLFEDDSADIANVVRVIKSILDVGAVITKIIIAFQTGGASEAAGAATAAGKDAAAAKDAAKTGKDAADKTGKVAAGKDTKTGKDAAGKDTKGGSALTPSLIKEVADALKGLVDSIGAALPLTQQIGGEAIILNATNKKVTNSNGGAVNSLNFQGQKGNYTLKSFELK